MGEERDREDEREKKPRKKRGGIEERLFIPWRMRLGFGAVE